jgi:hypothetical protein
MSTETQQLYVVNGKRDGIEDRRDLQEGSWSWRMMMSCWGR